MKRRCVDFIKQTTEQYGYKGCVVGISGGIDSAVVATLCVEALGRERVYGLLLPERDSADDTLEDSKSVCEFLKIDYHVKNIKKTAKALGVYQLKPPTFFMPRKIQEKYVKNKWEELAKKDTFLDDLEDSGNREFREGLAFYRAKHRIRMCALYLEAEQRNYAVVGTTNRTEYETGFYVKWGDDSVDIEPVMHLYKTGIYELAETLGIPEKIRNKPPSPDLIPGITDEFALKMTYNDLDRILRKMNTNPDTLKDEDDEKVKRVREILKAAEKRKVKNLNLLEAENPS